MKRVLARSFWEGDQLSGDLYSRYRLRTSSSRRVSPLSRVSGSYLSPFAFASFCSLLSSSMACQRRRTRSSCTASKASFCTWKRSITTFAFRKHALAILRMLLAMSRVTSVTLSRTRSGIFSSISMTSSDRVPRTMATIVPFPLWAALLLTMVYSSPCEGEVSSMLSHSPMFSGNSSHSSACLSWSHSRYPLRCSLYCLSSFSPSMP